MEEIITALELKKELDSLRPIDKEQEAKIMQKFRLDWNYHSNNLEGNSLTYGETKALLMHGITAQGKPLKDHFEVTGHNEAINWVMDVVKGEYPLTENFIRELHTLLLKEPYEVDAVTPDGKPTKKKVKVGSYKSSPNHVQTKTGEIFYFATPEETPAEMAALMEWYNQKIEEENVNPILLAAEFHYKFIRIHPFDDGNGRTARILMNFIFMKFGYPPVIIKTEDKANYFAALQLADTGNIEAFVTYIAKNLIRSLEIIIAGAKGEDIEEPDDIDKEIALLEKRLSHLGERSNMGKTKESLEIFIEETLLPFKSKLLSETEKFRDFYINMKMVYLIKMNVIEDDIYGQSKQVEKKYKYYDLENLIEKVTDSVIDLSLVVVYNSFNRVGFGEFNYHTEYKFKFTEIAYSLYYSNKAFLIEKKILEKPYGVGISEKEMKEIFKSELKAHKEFIEYRIAAKESK